MEISISCLLGFFSFFECFTGHLCVHLEWKLGCRTITALLNKANVVHFNNKKKEFRKWKWKILSLGHVNYTTCHLVSESVRGMEGSAFPLTQTSSQSPVAAAVDAAVK